MYYPLRPQPEASLPPPPDRAAHQEEEQLLMLALRDGDEAAAVQVMDRYFASMLRIAHGHVSDRSAAEEVVQETWLAAMQGIARFEGRSSVKTWLFHILRNVARSRGRRDDRYRSMATLQSNGDAGTTADPLEYVVDARGAAAGLGRAAMWAGHERDPEEQLLLSELGQQLDRALAALPLRQRELIVLRDVEGFTAAEACNVLGLSDTNQRVLLHRARATMKRALQRYFSDDGIQQGEQDAL